MVSFLGRDHDAPSLEVLANQQECPAQGLHKYYLVLRSLPASFLLILPSPLITQELLIDEDVPVDGGEMGISKEAGQKYTDKDVRWPLNALLNHK